MLYDFIGLLRPEEVTQDLDHGTPVFIDLSNLLLAVFCFEIVIGHELRWRRRHDRESQLSRFDQPELLSSHFLNSGVGLQKCNLLAEPFVLRLQRGDFLFHLVQLGQLGFKLGLTVATDLVDGKPETSENTDQDEGEKRMTCSLREASSFFAAL